MISLCSNDATKTTKQLCLNNNFGYPGLQLLIFASGIAKTSYVLKLHFVCCICYSYL